MNKINLDPNLFNINNLIKRAKSAEYTFEYNCGMRRIFPWGNLANTKRAISEFGLVWIEVWSGTDADAHEHDEEETFVIISGKAELELEGQMAILKQGDVVYIPRYWRHQMRNPFQEKLIFCDIYWDFKARTKQEYIASIYENA